MPGFSPSIPIHLFRGAEIETISVGASSLKLVLTEKRAIFLDYFGATEDKDSWLYSLPLCGDDSVQNLIGQRIVEILFSDVDIAYIKFSGGRVLKIVHDNPNCDLMRFVIDEHQYIA